MSLRSRISDFILSLLFLLSFSITCAAQSSEVVVNIAVQDEKGAAVNGLLADNFQITVDKTLQKIVSVRRNAGPVSIGVVIDDSGSMSAGARGAKIRSRLMEGFAQFVKVNGESNEYFTMLFNSKSTRVQDWSNDSSVLSTALAGMTGEGTTPLYDSLVRALTIVSSGTFQTHVLILISDGQDSMSKASFNKLRDELRKSDVILYAVGVIAGADAGSSLGMEGQAVLDELTTTTGGRAYFPQQNKDSEYAEAIAAIATDLQSQYQVVFVPDPPSTKKDWRKIKVKVSVPPDANRKKVVVRSRQAFR
jgi:VWFA-related protein